MAIPKGDTSPSNGTPRVTRPRTEDAERRLAGREGIERSEHQALREALGHDDLPREAPTSNLCRVFNYRREDPIRLHGKDPLGQVRGADKSGEYVHEDEDDN